MWIVCICRTMHIRGVVHRATTCRIYSKKFFLVSDVPLLPPNLIYLGGGPSKLMCHWDSPQFCNKSHIFLLSPLHCRAGLHCCLVSVHESIGLPSCVLCNLPCFFQCSSFVDSHASIFFCHHFSICSLRFTQPCPVPLEYRNFQHPWGLLRVP